MKSAGRRLSPLLGLLAIAFVLGGCLPYVAPEYGETPVYGNYGYVGPWVSSPFDVEGGYLVMPPYGHWEHDQREEHRWGRGRREEAGLERSARIERPPATHPMPSIPNNPRPRRPGGGGRFRR